MEMPESGKCSDLYRVIDVLENWIAFLEPRSVAGGPAAALRERMERPRVYTMMDASAEDLKDYLLWQ